MRPLLFGLILSSACAAASANTFHVDPQTLSVSRAERSAVISIQLTPAQNIDAVEVEFAIDLDEFAIVDVEPGLDTATRKTDCVLAGGRVRALAIDIQGSPFPQQAITLCKLRVRPHDDTPLSNYALKLQNTLASYHGTLAPTFVDNAVLYVVP